MIGGKEGGRATGRSMVGGGGVRQREWLLGLGQREERDLKESDFIW